MKASIIAISFIIATVHAAEQFDPIALGGHDKTDEHPTSALVDFVLDTEASADAGVDTVGKQKSLRGFKTASTRARTRNASTGIEPIDADGTVLGRGIRRAGASARTHVGLDVEGGEGGNDKNSIKVGGRMLQACSTTAGWHPQYLGGWAEGYCAFETHCGSPGYASELACCKAAYSNQSSGYCLSKLEAPPTTSPTTSDFTVDFWYPDYETAWPSAGCLNTLPLPYKNANDRPNYSTRLECCRGAYSGQMSGICLSQLESPPTTSPTNTGNTGSLYYPDYATAWPDAGCINVLPIPSGRPTYTSRLACCKGAYGGQVSGVCLSQLESPPSTSPTSVGGMDVYYPDYDTAWDKAACVNTHPMPSGRPVYSTMLACCKGAYAGQWSGYCISQLEAPPTTSPTSRDRTVDYWYPDYDSAWSHAGCRNSLPLPYSPGDRPTYSTNEACCAGAYGMQVSRACLCSMESPVAGCPTLSPTLSPQPTPTPPFPFTTNAVLKRAIQEYLSQDCTVTCQARTDYGGGAEVKIGDWDVSRVEDFSKLFFDAITWALFPGAATFNEPINWDTGSATDMSFMFSMAAAFNHPLDLDTSKVTTMEQMFFSANAFNQPLAFDTAEVTNMNQMFMSAIAFDQSLSSFNTAKVIEMMSMFNAAGAFNRPLSSFDTASVTNMMGMFSGATVFNQDLCHFGDNFSQYGLEWQTRNMFSNSGCGDTSTQPTSAAGPWCAVSICVP